MHSHRTALITGATGAIGGAIARGLAIEHGFRVALAARDGARAGRIVDEIGRRAGHDRVKVVLVDLSKRSDIERLVTQWEGPLNVLVNNASTTPRRRLDSEEGLEMQFAVNVMGYFRMIRAFAPILSDGAPARIINVASYWAGGLDLSDLQFQRRSYDNDSAYRQSKQAERMLTVAFADRLAHHGITVNACHPGDVNSRLSNALGFGGHESPEEAAETPVYLAASPDVEGISGAYFEHGRRARCRFGEDREGIAKLFKICSEIG